MKIYALDYFQPEFFFIFIFVANVKVVHRISKSQIFLNLIIKIV